MEKLIFLQRTSRVDTSVATPEMRFKKYNSIVSLYYTQLLMYERVQIELKYF